MLAPDLLHLDFNDAAGAPRFRLDLATLHDRGRLRLRFEVIGEQHFYGLGQGGAPFDRLGVSRRLWNAHVNHGQGGDVAIPLLLSHLGDGLFFDTSSKAWIDCGESYDATWFDMTCDVAGLDLWVIAGNGLATALAAVATLLGRAPMPPRWALGYMQSTRHFDSAAELASLPRQFRERQLPLDCLILLSSYGDQRGWNRGVGELEFEPDLVPDPAALVDRLHADHVKLMLHEYPVLSRTSSLHRAAIDNGVLLDAAYPEPTGGQPAANWHQGQRYIDFDRQEAASWWWDQHCQLVAWGVDAWWLDGGEGPSPPSADPDGLADQHNRYDLARQRAFAAGEERDRPGQRAFLLCRSGGPGMQAAGGALWSGDVNGSFASLAAQPATALNAGLSGVPWWGSDIGGYYTTMPDTAELFVRWFQFGAFCPLFRAHGRDWRQHLPWAHGEAVEAICRDVLEWRYRLMPYNYTLAWQAHSEGLPMMRPMALRYVDDPKVLDMGSQFLWGDCLLVAPVTQPGATHWPVYLPPGAWHDFWTHEIHQGNTGITSEAPLSRIPLFARAGAIIPLGPVLQHLDGPGRDPLTVRIYPGPDARFTLYEDDGVARDYLQGCYRLIRFDCVEHTDGLVCSIDGEPSVGRTITLHVFLGTAPAAVGWLQDDAAVAPAWHYDGHFLHVAVGAWPAAILIRR